MTDDDKQEVPTGEAIADIVISLSNRMDDELYALTEQELAGQWFFVWDDHANIAWNIYQFSSALETYKRRCRRWETHHNGFSSVVERVRDKYLMPKITAFAADLDKRIATNGGRDSRTNFSGDGHV